jgi:hypothetical protein
MASGDQQLAILGGLSRTRSQRVAIDAVFESGTRQQVACDGQIDVRSRWHPQPSTEPVGRDQDPWLIAGRSHLA